MTFNPSCQPVERHVHIDLFDPGGQEGTGVDWQRCGGEGSEEWNRSEDILAQAA